MSFPLCDLVLAVFLLLALRRGWQDGTVKVLARYASIIIAYIAARSCSGWLAWLIQGLLPELEPATEAGEKLLLLLYLFCDVEGLVARLLGLAVFAAVFFLTLWLVRRLASALTGLFGDGLLGRVNRLLGAVLSLLIGVVCLLLLNDIFFPVLARLGVEAPLEFMKSSRLVLPGLYRLLFLLGAAL